MVAYYSGNFICFFLTYFVYISSFQKVHYSFYELSVFGSVLHSRVRRSNSISSDGVNYVGNKTNCHDQSQDSVGNCTITEQFIQDHEYYRTYYYPEGSSYFVDLNEQAKLKKLVVKKHENLSSSYKKTFRIPINFHFPFYGNYVDKIVVTTGGFINIGPRFHSFVHKVHYIAPLMADFDPRINNNSVVYIAKNNDLVIVQWTNFLLNTKKYADELFTFQVSLHKNGTVIMAYKNIPIPPSKLISGNVDVTVGFSDGFIITYKRYDRFKLVIHNRIYLYHMVNFSLSNIKSNAAYKLVLLPNCIQFKSCFTCLNDSKYSTNFNCRWCPKLNQCSDALDWHRQNWMKHCKNTAFVESHMCQSSLSGKIKLTKKKDGLSRSNSTAGIVIGMVLSMVLIVLISVFIYAYTHPLSKAGLFLIENRRPWKRFQKLVDEEVI